MIKVHNVTLIEQSSLPYGVLGQWLYSSLGFDTWLFVSVQHLAQQGLLSCFVVAL